MDVSLSGTRVFFGLLALLSLNFISCGNRYDLSTERGRRSRIDDANFHLSKGQCGAAAEAIDPLYDSIYVTDEVRIIKASAFACFARYKMLNFVSNFAGATDFFQAMVKSLDSTTGDNARSSLYSAVDVLTVNGTVMNGTARSRAVNSFMVFLQFGVISSILRNYGSPTTDGAQGAVLVYETAGLNPVGEMTNPDACALAAAFSFISDSYDNSELNDTTTRGAVDGMNAVCVAAGSPSCASINRVRSACDGTNAESAKAVQVVTSVNTTWL